MSEPEERSPRAAAEDAKARRDLPGEIGALTGADRDLRAQPWFPIQPGDVVCWSIEMPDGSRHGETLLAVDDPMWPTEGGAPLRSVSETPHDYGPVDEDEDEPYDPADDLFAYTSAPDIEYVDDVEDEDAEEPEPGDRPNYQDFYDVWFEAGPHRVAVIRHGQLVHDTLSPPAGR
jgi:hypothetical protein